MSEEDTMNRPISSRLAHAHSERGEIFLLRRDGDGALELRVNGIFVMDTVHTATERLLASMALDRSLRRPPPAEKASVLIGGLGLGFTLQEVLGDERVGRAHVVEIEPALVEWHRQRLIPHTESILDDDRVHLSIGDVTDIVAALPPSSVDVLLLDVDNGPDFLVYENNSVVYRRDFLVVCREKLSACGTVAIWSADSSPDLSAALRDAFADCEEVTIPVSLGGTATTYHLFVARRSAATAKLVQ